MRKRRGFCDEAEMADRDGTGWLRRQFRTWEWRNQNPRELLDMYSISARMLHLSRAKQGSLRRGAPLLFRGRTEQPLKFRRH